MPSASRPAPTMVTIIRPPSDDHLTQRSLIQGEIGRK
jgi:hypothetical protein